MTETPHQPHKSVLSDKIIRNTAANAVGRAWFMIVGLFLTPYIVRHIGIERFAVWALVGTLTGYFGLLDFGVGSSFVRYVSEFYTKKEYEQINRLVNTGFWFYAVFAAVVVGAVTLGMQPLLSVLKVPAYLRPEASFVFLLGIIIFCGSNAAGPIMAVQSGLQRMDISNAIAIFASVVTILGTVFFLETGWGLRGLMINNAIVFLVTSCAHTIVAYRLLPRLQFRPLRWDSSMFKRIFTFGWNIQVSRISGTVVTQTDKILITYFLSIGLVTFYQLGSSIVAYTMAIPALLISALVPAFSEIHARGESRRLVEAYVRSIRYLSFFTAPLFVLVFAGAAPIMRIWMGNGYRESSVIIQILCLGFLLNMVARVSAALCMAIEKPQYLMRGSLITIAVNIIASIALIRLLGFQGVAWGTVIAVNAGTVYFLNALHRSVHVSGREYLKATMPFLLVAACTMGVTALVFLALDVAFTQRNRLLEFALLMGHCVTFGCLYLVGVVQAKLFTDEDHAFFTERFPKIYRIVTVLVRRI